MCQTLEQFFRQSFLFDIFLNGRDFLNGSGILYRLLMDKIQQKTQWGQWIFEG